MESIDDEIVERIEDGVKEFIDIISANKSSPPEEEIKTSATGKEEFTDRPNIDSPEFYATQKEVIIPKPSEVVSEYKRVGSFDEIAEWLISEDSPVDSDWDDEEKQQAQEYWISRLRDLAGETMDYYGGFGFSEQAFESAFNGLLKRSFVDNPTYKMVIPLVNFSGNFEQISLDYPNSIKTSSKSSHKSGEMLNIPSNIKITELSDEDRSAMLNAAEDSSYYFGSMHRIQGTHKVEFEIEQGTFNIDPVKKHVIAFLRLFQPKKMVSLGKEYMFNGRWLHYEKNIPQYNKRPREETGPNFISENPYVVEEGDDDDDLVEFWDRYSKYILDAFIGKEDSNFSRPIQRFNEMYDERKNEDSIIDCFISIEQTILKDIRPSYKFRFPARSALLLNEVTKEKYTSEYIYDFFNRLHHVRNEIIHGDKTINEINEDVELQSIEESDLEAEQFVKLSRYFLASSILRYMDFENDKNQNMTDVNIEIIDPAMKMQLRKVPYEEE